MLAKNHTPLRRTVSLTWRTLPYQANLEIRMSTERGTLANSSADSIGERGGAPGWAPAPREWIIRTGVPSFRAEHGVWPVAGGAGDVDS
jgi:hypothetical protein